MCVFVIVCVFVILCLCATAATLHCIVLCDGSGCLRDAYLVFFFASVFVLLCVFVFVCVRVQLQQHCIAQLCAVDQGAAGGGSA